MAGDLEDFLRRAAEKRKAKEGGGQAQGQRPAAQPQQQRPARPAAPQRPQPTRSPQRPQARPVEPILVAEVVEDPMAEKRLKLEQARRKAADAQAKAKRDSSTGQDAGVGGVASQSKDSTAQQLLDLLRRPQGIQQAILVREILDRPEHRW